MATKKAVPETLPTVRVQNSFLKLKSESESLNQASDKMNESAAKFNAALKPLGLGISSWYQFDGKTDAEKGFTWSQEIGYTKISGKWGLAIRRTTHEFSDPEPETESWPFAEAPRALRVKAALHIPDLLDEMIQDTARTAAEVTRHTDEIDALTAAISDLDNTAKSSAPVAPISELPQPAVNYFSMLPLKMTGRNNK